MASKNTLSSDAWDEIHTYLQTTNPISTNNIFGAMNSTLVKDNGYPIVIIGTPLASLQKLNVTGEFIMSEINISIEAYQTSQQGVKVLKDEIVAKLLAGRITFAGNGFKRMQLSGGDYDTWLDGRKKIHRLSFDITFMYFEE